jgi:hypothetical protein
MEKLGLKEDGLRIFDAEDGAEIDEDECLLEYDKGTTFLISKEWKFNPETQIVDNVDEIIEVSTPTSLITESQDQNKNSEERNVEAGATMQTNVFNGVKKDEYAEEKKEKVPGHYCHACNAC